MSSEFNPYVPGADERYEAMAGLRGEGHVVQTAVGTYLPTFDAVTAALQQVEHFVGSFIDTSALPEDEIIIAAVPEPKHSQIRKVINSAIARHKTAKAEPFVRDLAERLIDATLQAARDNAGRIDLMSTYVNPLPSTVIAHVLGVPTDRFLQFQVWSDELLERQMTAGATTLAGVHPEFGAYIQELIEERRADPDKYDDFVSRLIATEIDGVAPSDAAVRTQTMFMIVAGNETTRNMIGNCLRTLAERPDLFALLEDDRTRIASFIEESLRHDSPVQILARNAMSDVDVAGCPVQHGTGVIVGLASANRDETRFEQPEEFLLGRERPQDHVAFGAGPHICPGAFLARMEAEAAIEVFLDRVAEVGLLADEPVVVNPVFWALGPRTLPVAIRER